MEQLVNLAERAGLTGLDDLRPEPEVVEPWNPSELLHGARVRALVEDVNDKMRSRLSESESISEEDVKREIEAMLQRAGVPSENIEAVFSRMGENVGWQRPEFLQDEPVQEDGSVEVFEVDDDTDEDFAAFRQMSNEQRKAFEQSATDYISTTNVDAPKQD